MNRTVWRFVSRVLLIGGLLSSGCSDRELPVQSSAASPPVLSDLRLPQIFNPNRIHSISVRVTHSAGSRSIHSVECRVLGLGDRTELTRFALYDDGDARGLGSGDLVAFDGVFSRQLWWDQVSDTEQAFLFVFQATDDTNLQSESLEVAIRSAPWLAPILLEISIPDYLPSGFQETRLLTAVAADSNGIQDIQAVYVDGYKQGIPAFVWTLIDRGEQGDVVAGDGLFSLAIDRSAGAALKGLYELEIAAEDLSGARSEAKYAQVTIENEPPVIANIVAPDSLLRPEPGVFDVHLVSVCVDDPQTLADISRVRLEWVKPDGSYASGGRYFDLFDNGLPYDLGRWDQGYRGDETAGDGVFSTVVIFGARAQDEQPLLGNYTLTFQAEDKVGQLSNALVKTITLK
ncbi:hypothetical protein JW992_09975 [candidate division KSB1 bacterium]|nr:hypothetical protein [candidate division KSB1 bacterium]